MRKDKRLQRGPRLQLLASLLAAAACACSTEAAPEPSSASRGEVDAASVVRIVSVQSGKVLDVAGGSSADGALVQQWGYAGGDNQKWRMHDTGSGVFALVNVRSGKCLDVTALSHDDGARIEQWSCNGGENQAFTLRPAGDGSFDLVGAGSGKCVDVAGASGDDGAFVQQWGCVGAANQRWRIENVDRQTGAALVNQLLVSQLSGTCVDVTGAKTDNGSPLMVFPCNGGANQRWDLLPETDGSYRVVGRQSGKCLDVPGGAQDDSLRLQIWDCWGGAPQRWYLDAGAGFAQLRNQASGKCLDIAAAGDGTPVQQYSCHTNGNFQRWTITDALGGATPPPPSAGPAPRLHIGGNQLLDPNGNNVLLHGLHTPIDPWFNGQGKIWSGKNNPQGAVDYINRLINTFTDASPRYGSAHGWAMNEIRLSSSAFWHGDWTDGSFSMSDLATFTDQVLVPIVQHAKQHGMYVVIFPGVTIPDHTTTPELQAASGSDLGLLVFSPCVEERRQRPLRAMQRADQCAGGRRHVGRGRSAEVHGRAGALAPADGRQDP